MSEPIQVTLLRVGSFWDAYEQRNTCQVDEMWNARLWRIGKRRALVRLRERRWRPMPFLGPGTSYKLLRIHPPQSRRAREEAECVF